MCVTQVGVHDKRVCDRYVEEVKVDQVNVD